MASKYILLSLPDGRRQVADVNTGQQFIFARPGELASAEIYPPLEGEALVAFRIDVTKWLEKNYPELACSDVKVRLGAKLAKLRKSAGMTQAQASEKLGVTQSVVANTERGASNCTIERLEAYANLYGATIEIVKYD